MRQSCDVATRVIVTWRSLCGGLRLEVRDHAQAAPRTRQPRSWAHARPRRRHRSLATRTMSAISARPLRRLGPLARLDVWPLALAYGALAGAAATRCACVARAPPLGRV